MQHVEYAVVNLEKNEERLKELPHKIWNDLAVIYKLYVSTENQKGKILLNNQMLENEGISLEELDAAARENTLKRGFEVIAMSETLKRMGVYSDEESEFFQASEQLYIGSNMDRFDGANILLYPELIHPLAEEKGCDLLIAPSSIHEIIIFTDLEDCCIRERKEIVADVNLTDVLPEEILSYSLYKYSRETKQITVVA